MESPMIPVPRGNSDRAPSAATLLERMRTGDRSACGEFMLHYGDLLRLRIRDKLSVNLRLVLDSEDVLSTVTRRLDVIVCSERLRAESDRQLWALVMQIAKNVVSENVKRQSGSRMFIDRLANLEDEAAKGAVAGDEADPDLVHRALRILPCQEDRFVLRKRISGCTHDEIALLSGSTPAAVRMRWSRILKTLRENLERSEA